MVCMYIFIAIFVLVFLVFPLIRYLCLTVSDWWRGRQRTKKPPVRQRSLKEIDREVMRVDEFIEI